MLAELTDQGRLLELNIDGERVWVAAEAMADKLYLLRGRLAEFHQQHPLRSSYPRWQAAQSALPRLQR